MPITLLHLGDMHFRDGDNEISAALIANAALSFDVLADGFLIVVSGDVAFSGRREEYAQAVSFFKCLRDRLEASGSPRRPVKFIAVPGNHDCSLDGSESLRSTLRDGVLKHGPDPEVLRQLLSAQMNFFSSFQAELTGEASPPVVANCEDFSLAGARFRALTINTSVTSMRKEERASLYACCPDLPGTGAGPITIAVLHHPLHWLAPQCATTTRDFIERHASVAFTGHEHNEHATRTQDSRDRHVDWFAASEFDARTGCGAFHLISIDPKGPRVRWCCMERNDPAADFSEKNCADWRPLKTQTSGPHGLTTTASRRELLDSPGRNFTHRRCPVLRLSDIYVDPAFSLDRRRARHDATHTASLAEAGTIKELLASERVLILGGEDSGKTTIAKRLYQEHLSAGLLPLWIDGANVRSASDAEVNRLIKTAFHADYEGEYSVFAGLDASTKVLILDDWHLCRLDPTPRDVFVDRVSACFGTLCFLADDSLNLKEAVPATSRHVVTWDRAEIRPLGRRQQDTLIRKWLTAGEGGAHTDEKEEELDTSLRQLRDTIDTVCGRSLLERYPFVILTLLQTIDALGGSAVFATSYSELYNSLITMDLSRASQSVGIDIDTVRVFLAMLAHRLFKDRARDFDMEGVEAVAADYEGHFKIALNTRRVVESLVSARILHKGPDGRYSFRFTYYEYYFVAVWYQWELNHRSTRPGALAELRQFVQQIHHDIQAQVLTFVIYLTRDEDLIDAVLSQAEGIYADHPEFSFEADGDASFWNALYREQTPLSLPAQGTSGAADAGLDSDDDGEDRGETARRHEKTDEILAIDRAIRTLKLAGQIVRNFPGALTGQRKAEIVGECFGLGLRTLHALLAACSANLGSFRSLFREIVREHRITAVAPRAVELNLADEREIAIEADEWLIRMAGACSYYLVKLISGATGREVLSETFKEVDRNRCTLATSIIHSSIQLDHFSKIQVKPLKELAANTRDNFFTFDILRRMIFWHLRLHRVEHKKRQALLAEFGISEGPKTLGAADRR